MSLEPIDTSMSGLETDPEAGEQGSASPGGRNVLLRIAYDGTDYAGWQIQPSLPTVQGLITEAFEKATGERVHVCGAGRTDAGVHALAQAASIRVQTRIPAENLVIALNNHLPESIRILSSVEVPWEFHAQHDAIWKIYRYRLYRASICPPW